MEFSENKLNLKTEDGMFFSRIICVEPIKGDIGEIKIEKIKEHILDLPDEVTLTESEQFMKVNLGLLTSSHKGLFKRLAQSKKNITMTYDGKLIFTYENKRITLQTIGAFTTSGFAFEISSQNILRLHKIIDQCEKMELFLPNANKNPKAPLPLICSLTPKSEFGSNISICTGIACTITNIPPDKSK